MNKRIFKKYIKKNGIDDKSREFFRIEFLDDMEIKKEDIDYIINLYVNTKAIVANLRVVKKMGSNFSSENYKKFLEFRKKYKYDNSSDKYYQIVYGKNWKEKKKNRFDFAKNSLEGFIKRYGKEEGRKKYNNFLEKISKAHTLENYIAKYGEEEGTKKWKNYKKKLSFINSKEGFIKRYGEEEGTKKYKEHCEKLSFNLSKAGYIARYGEEGTQKFNELHKKISFLNSKEGYIVRYGKEEGKKKWDDYCKKLSKAQTLEGYIERYGEEEGSKKYRERCKKMSEKNTLEGYIERYGEEEGSKKYRERCEKQSFNLSEIGYIARYGEEEGKKKFKDNIDKWTKNTRVSKASIKFFNELDSLLEDDLIFGEGKELRLSDGKHSYFYDATYKNNYVIEFHGDVFHGNPEIYGPDDHCHPYKKNVTAKELWKHDAKKKKVAEDNGYTYIYFWENEKPKNAYKKLLEMGIK